MRILTWNIAFLPKKLNILRDPNGVLYNVLDKILDKNPDIINLQEVFDYKLQNQISNILKLNNYNISCSKKTDIMSKNGLLIGVKDTIINKKELNYSNATSTGPEILINKGIISVETPNYIIHNTHLQSDNLGYMVLNNCIKKRENQFKEIGKYLQDFKKEKMNIICGDLNEDYNKLNNFIDLIPFKCKYNKNKIITFPSNNKQLDYIIVSGEEDISYYIDNNKFSDHTLLYCDIHKKNRLNNINNNINNILSDH